MNKTIGVQLVIYSLLLAGLGYLAYAISPTAPRTTLILGMAGGALCLVWGIRAIAGSKGKALSVLTLVPVTFVLISQAVMGWGLATGDTKPGLGFATIVTGLLILSFVMLMKIMWAGAESAAPGGSEGQVAAK